jgi:hypothetical protein
MGRLRVGWLVRVISESFSILVLKTCGPINTTRETSICSLNRRNRAIHDHSLPISVLSLLDPPIQWFFLVFGKCCLHRESFSPLLGGGGSAPRPMTLSATLGLAFLMKPFLARLVCHTLLQLYIRMLGFTFILRVAAAVSLSVRRTRPASTGFQHLRGFTMDTRG